MNPILPKTKHVLFPNLSLRDVFGLIIFLQIPLAFFLSNFVASYKAIYYAILVIFVIIYTLAGQFFFEQQKLTSLGKKLIALTAINTIILSFIDLTGGLVSPYFFITYLLIFMVSVYLSPEFLVLECLIIIGCIISSELYSRNSIQNVLASLGTRDVINLVSIVVAIPVGVVTSLIVKNLRKRQGLLDLSRELLEVRDIEDEALLKKVNQGVIILDTELNILKVSRWIEKKLKVSPQILLEKNIRELSFYDTVSELKLPPSDYFYKNLESRNPQELSWKLNYRNQYGKYQKFLVRQIPLKAQEQLIGFMLTIRNPSKNMQEAVSSFSQLFSFRLSSSLVVLRNLLNISSVKNDPVYPNLEKHLELMVNTLNDASIKNDIIEGNLIIKTTRFGLAGLVQKVIDASDMIKDVSIWNVSPLYKNQQATISSDHSLCFKLIAYVLKGAANLSDDPSVSISLGEDDNTQKPKLTVSVALREDIPDGINILEPFFAGRLIILAKYRGTGLEIYNASLLAEFLAFDFNATISNNKLVIQIIF
ncbi:MAG: hypothetical protein PHS44_05135 [Candidatus Dojkabacteria bacterium]|nr:hypothetical protein [Candidatus Dojkabacteria bacterium]